MAKKNGITISDALIPKDDYPYDVPNNWCWVKLGAISSIISKGTTPKGGKSAYVDEGIDFLRVENINDDGTICHDNMMHVTEETHTGFLKRSMLEENDVLVSIAGTLGKTAIVKKDDLPLNTNQAVAFVRLADNGEISRDFIRYAIDTPVIQNMLLAKTKVTAIPNLTLEIISDCLIPLPPLAEQKRIVEQIENLFTKLDEAKDKLQEALDSFDSRKNAILYKSLSGDYTRTWRVKNNISLEDWNEYTIEEICVNIVDCPHTTPEWTEEGVLCLRTTNIKLGYFDFSEIQYVDADTYRERTERLVPKEGDLVFTREGSVGDVALVPANTKLCLGQRMMLMRTSEKCLPEYLLYFLISPFIRNYIKENIMGTTAPRMNIKDIKKLKIQVPPVEEQAEIIKIIKPLLQCDADAKELADTRQNIDMIKKSILAKAFRGELGTNDSSEESSIELLKAIMKE